MSKRNSQSLSSLRALLTSGVDVMTQMPVTAEHLRRVIPAFSLSMIRVDERCAPQHHYSEHFDDFSHHLFSTSGHLLAGNPGDPASFGSLLRNADPVGTLVDGRPAYLAGDTYQHLFKRNGIHHCLDLALRDGDCPLGILGIFREKDARPFSAKDVALARTLYPWLVHALAHPAAESPFEETQSGMLTASLEGRILWASEVALRWLEDGSGGPERALLRDGELLPAACRFLCQQLARGSKAAAEVPTVSLPVPGGRLRLRGYAIGAPGERGQVGIHLSLELSQALRVLHALEGQRLAPQLKRLAFRFWQGRDSRQIATELELSVETFKSYRKELYTRLDVTSVEELKALLDRQARAVSFDLSRHRPSPPSRG
ncbi:MAG: LuxR C-terminal-related transcriptional regulator [Archangium sp.]|nr:LuxR C-terminal-related transcriptional regulator [Archangium sp.]MDP3154591.1 LuxR C-terminal-related transcriptional regulator [Archangium sp.]MDP3574341.1 LuxR C-terminal-related transcriptional regulator [Archangium sp.]